MLDVLCNETLKDINEQLEKLNEDINGNVRTVSHRGGDDVLFDITEYGVYDEPDVYEVRHITNTHIFGNNFVQRVYEQGNLNEYFLTDDNSRPHTHQIEDKLPAFPMYGSMTNKNRNVRYIVGDESGLYFKEYPYPSSEDNKHKFYGGFCIYQQGFYIATWHNKFIPPEGQSDPVTVTYFIYELKDVENTKHYTMTFNCTGGLRNNEAPKLWIINDPTQPVSQSGNAIAYIDLKTGSGGSSFPECTGNVTVTTVQFDGEYSMGFTVNNSAETKTSVYLYIDFSDVITSCRNESYDSVLTDLIFDGKEPVILSKQIGYNGKWYDLGGAGGGGSSDVELIEISKAAYDALPQSEKDDPNKAYFVYNYPSGSGGSGGGSGNTISYGTTAPSATANDGDLYFYLDSTTNKEKGKYLYMNNAWVLIDGQPPFDGSIYDEGAEGVELGLYQATKEATYIEINNGGGYLNYYTNTVNKIDVTDFDELYCKYQFNGTEYEQTVDISSYTGEKYIMFHYFSGYGFNNCAVSITDELYTSTTFPATDVIELTRSLVENTVKTKVRKMILR